MSDAISLPFIVQPYSPTADGTKNYTFNVGAMVVRITVVARDNPSPWQRFPTQHGIVTEWTNRDHNQDDERILFEFQPFTQSIARRGKLIYMWTDTLRQRFGGSTLMAEDDFKRLQAWCRGEWYYVDVKSSAGTDDKVLGTCFVTSIPNDMQHELHNAAEYCAHQAVKQARAQLWANLAGMGEDEAEAEL